MAFNWDDFEVDPAVAATNAPAKAETQAFNWDAYDSEGINAPLPKAPSESAPSELTSALGGAISGANVGFADEIGGGVYGLYDALKRKMGSGVKSPFS